MLSKSLKPEFLSDEDLWRYCLLRPWERMLDGLGCIAYTALTLILVLGGEYWLYLGYARMPRSLGFPVVALLAVLPLGCLALFGSLAMFWIATALTARRAQPCLAELRQRCGQGAFASYLERERHHLEADDPPDWVFLLQGHTLPEGASCWLKIDLKGNAGHLILKNAPLLETHGDDLPTPDQLESRAVDLSATTCQPLLDYLAQVDTAALTALSSPQYEGFTCRVAVLRRLPFAQWTGGCHLSGVTTEHALDGTTARLVAVLLHAAAEHSTNKLLLGWSAFMEKKDNSQRRDE